MLVEVSCTKVERDDLPDGPLEALRREFPRIEFAKSYRVDDSHDGILILVFGLELSEDADLEVIGARVVEIYNAYDPDPEGGYTETATLGNINGSTVILTQSVGF